MGKSCFFEKSIKMRESKEVKIIPHGSVVNIDGFNTIITLEVALSDSLLLKCMEINKDYPYIDFSVFTNY